MKRYHCVSNIYGMNECIIVASKFKNNAVIIAKNRDRMYVPEIKIVHKIKNGVEIAFIYDINTGWAEGLNEYGIGILNTALMVGHDEKEQKIVKKTGIKSKDGKKIIKALSYDNIENVLDSIVHYGDKEDVGVKGHTFVISSSGEGYAVEVTSKHEAEVKSLDMSQINVRTNHGFYYTDAGYTDGDDYLSSKMRKAQAEKIPQDIGAKGILNYLKKQNYKKDSNLNMNRDTNKMKTTGQILLDLTNLILYYDSINGKSDFIKIDNQLPDNYKPKIKIKLFVDTNDVIK